MSCTHGANCRLAINGKHYGFAKFMPNGVVKQLVDGSIDAIRGYMDLSANRRTEGPLLANFDILLEPTWPEMTELLDDFLGFDVTSGQYEIAENATARDVLVDYDFNVTKFANTKCGGFEWSGNKGTGPCKLMLHCFAENWQVDQTWAATAIDEDIPYAFNGVAGLNLPGKTDADFDRFKLSVDRHMFVEHNNSITPTDICPRYTEVVFATNNPYVETHKNILHRWLSSADGADIELSFTAGSRSTVFTCGYAQAIAQGVPIPGKQNIRNGIFYRCGRYVDPNTDAITPSLTVDHTVP